MGKLILNHLIGNSCPVFHYGHLECHFFKLTLGNDCLELFLDSRFKIYPDSVMLQKSLSLSNQSFKYNALHMPSLNLTQKLPFEPMFSMFIINVYYTNRFDLRIRGTFFTILVEVFTNHILAENIYFKNHSAVGGSPPQRKTLPASPISLSSKSFVNTVFY